jgi:hypothetical protein
VLDVLRAVYAQFKHLLSLPINKGSDTMQTQDHPADSIQVTTMPSPQLTFNIETLAESVTAKVVESVLGRLQDDIVASVMQQLSADPRLNIQPSAKIDPAVAAAMSDAVADGIITADGTLIDAPDAATKGPLTIEEIRNLFDSVDENPFELIDEYIEYVEKAADSTPDIDEPDADEPASVEDLHVNIYFATEDEQEAMDILENEVVHEALQLFIDHGHSVSLTTANPFTLDDPRAVAFDTLKDHGVTGIVCKRKSELAESETTSDVAEPESTTLIKAIPESDPSTAPVKEKSPMQIRIEAISDGCNQLSQTIRDGASLQTYFIQQLDLYLMQKQVNAATVYGDLDLMQLASIADQIKEIQQHHDAINLILDSLINTVECEEDSDPWYPDTDSTVALDNQTSAAPELTNSKSTVTITDAFDGTLPEAKSRELTNSKSTVVITDAFDGAPPKERIMGRASVRQAGRDAPSW